MKLILISIVAGILAGAALAQFSSSHVMGKRPIDSAVVDGCQFKYSSGSAKWICSGGVTASDPGCTVAADLGKQWVDTSSAVTTHLKVCVMVASVATWVQVI